MKNLLRTILLCLSAGLLFAPSLCCSQAFPSKPIRIVVPFTPGGGVDFQARPLSQKMTESMGQPVVLENRAGADGAIGAEYVARSAPDGYTVVYGTIGSQMLNAVYHRKLSYDPVKDFTPITETVKTVLVLVAHPGAKMNSVSDLIERAKKQPGSISFSSSGLGSPQHVAGEMLRRFAGIDILHVPYKGAAQAVTDILSGVVAIGFVTASTVQTQIQQGKLKALGIIGADRYPSLPNVPHVGETVPGVELVTWAGILGPARLPADILGKLNQEFVKALRAADVVKLFESNGLIVVGNTPEQFAATIASDLVKWRKLADELGLVSE
jgi:tripartite-type tricarboxylate transporter receptor subunit TctC